MFRSMEERDIPFVDVLSWVFGNADYDHDRPVRLSYWSYAIELF
jgi:hypothetical protein